MTYSFSYLEPVCCSMSSSNCCFLNCIQVSQEAGQVIWYSHLLKNFPQFFVIHTVKGFGIVNKAEIDVFLELYELAILLSPISFSVSSFNCCFLTCIQISPQAGQVVRYSCLLRNFPQFVVIHAVKDLAIVHKSEIDVFCNSLAFSMIQQMLVI